MPDAGTDKGGNGKGFYFALAATLAAITSPGYIMLAAMSDRQDRQDTRVDRVDETLKSEKADLDRKLQKEITDENAKTDERVNNVKNEMQVRVDAARELREAQFSKVDAMLSELARRLSAVETPTNMVRNAELEELRRRIELLEVLSSK